MKTILYLSPCKPKIHMLTNLLLMLMKLWEGLINILELLILDLVWVYPYLDDPPIKFGTRTLEHKFEYDLLSPATIPLCLILKINYIHRSVII